MSSRNFVSVRAVVAICWRRVAMRDYTHCAPRSRALIAATRPNQNGETAANCRRDSGGSETRRWLTHHYSAGLRADRSDDAEPWWRTGNHKFLQDVGGRIGSDSDGSIVESESGAVAVGAGIIKIGNSAGGQAAKNSRIVWLPAAIVAFANQGHGDGVEKARAKAAGAFIEVARVLLEQRGQDGAADEGAADSVGIVGGK